MKLKSALSTPALLAALGLAFGAAPQIATAEDGDQISRGQALSCLHDYEEALEARIDMLANRYDAQRSDISAADAPLGAFAAPFVIESLLHCEWVFASEPAFQPRITFGFLAHQAEAPAPASPASAGADGCELYAEACAVFYFQASRSNQAPEVIAGFRQINQQNRWDILVQSFDLDQDNIIAEAMFGFGPVGAVMVNEKLDSRDLADRILAVSVLSDCDQFYGFTPVFTLKTESAVSVQDINDFDSGGRSS